MDVEKLKVKVKDANMLNVFWSYLCCIWSNLLQAQTTLFQLWRWVCCMLAVRHTVEFLVFIAAATVYLCSDSVSFCRSLIVYKIRNHVFRKLQNYF